MLLQRERGVPPDPEEYGLVVVPHPVVRHDRTDAHEHVHRVQRPHIRRHLPTACRAMPQECHVTSCHAMPCHKNVVSRLRYVGKTNADSCPAASLVSLLWNQPNMCATRPPALALGYKDGHEHVKRILTAERVNLKNELCTYTNNETHNSDSDSGKTAAASTASSIAPIPTSRFLPSPAKPLLETTKQTKQLQRDCQQCQSSFDILSTGTSLCTSYVCMLCSYYLPTILRLSRYISPGTSGTPPPAPSGP